MKTFNKIAIGIMTTSALVTAGSLTYSWYTQTHKEDTPVITVATSTSTTEETTSNTEETTTHSTEETAVDFRQYDTVNVINWVDGDTLLLGDYPYNVYDIVGMYLIVGTYDEQHGEQVYTIVDLGNGQSPMKPINDYERVVNTALEQSKTKMYQDPYNLLNTYIDSIHKVVEYYNGYYIVTEECQTGYGTKYMYIVYNPETGELAPNGSDMIQEQRDWIDNYGN